MQLTGKSVAATFGRIVSTALTTFSKKIFYAAAGMSHADYFFILFYADQEMEARYSPLFITLVWIGVKVSASF